MAGKALKGLTIKFGGDTSELNKALKGVENQGRSLSSELGQINRLLKLDPGNTELLAQKQKVLADAIGTTEKKLEILREAEKQVQEQFENGEVSEEQYRALQREIIATEKKLDAYKKAARDTAESVEKLGNESSDTADDLEKTEAGADDAAESLDALDDSSSSLAMGGLAALTAAAAATLAAIVALAEETREYRTAMGKLNTAFRDAGLGTEAATKTYQELQGVLGETDQAVEAANHLAKLCDSEEDLAKWTEIATGVYATFGASLPIEGLTEAANETAKTGKLTGGLADALNWAGISEEEFQASLDKCSTEQQRQQKITNTLINAYSNAARQYKVTNEEVIRANKANEKWNATLAKIGKTVEPVVTDIKELGTALLEDASEPLEDLADFIRKDVLPAIKDIGNWVKRNLPMLKSLLVGAATAMVAFKVATIATTVAQTGLKGALAATTLAQKALTLAQAASPTGLLITAVAALTAGLVALGAAMTDAKKPADTLTEAERELMEAADEAAEAFREQKKATEEAMAGIQSEYGHVAALADELFRLGGETGYVAQQDKERAEFILNELNKALGTEYSMTDNLIRNYQHLKRSVDELIQSKLANSLLEAANADYVAAIQNEAEAWSNAQLKLKDYEAQQAVYDEANRKAVEARAALSEKIANAKTEADYRALASEANYVANLERLAENEKGILDDKKAKYDAAKSTYDSLRETIDNYQYAQEQALAGNYQAAVDIFSKKDKLYIAHSDTVDEETARVIATLEKAAYDAGEKAKRTKENFEKGMAGYTEDSVKEAEQAYQEALGKWASAYTDANGLGQDFGQGLADGIKLKNGVVGAAAIAQIREAVAAAKKEAEMNSPSKKTMAIGEGLGEGAEVGIDNTTEDVAQAGRRQMAAVLGAYSEQETAGQQALRHIAEQQAAAFNSHSIQAASTTAPLLEKILDAIKEGKVLTIDGDALVGATVDRMDTALGRRRVLATRGAI